MTTQRSGQILIFFLTTMIIGLLLATSLLSLEAAAFRSSKNIAKGKEAYYLAEAGIDKGHYQFKNDSNYTGESLALGNGNLTIAVTPGATANEKILSAVATIDGKSRRLRVKLGTSPEGVAVSFRYALQSGTDGFTLGNNSQVNGNVYSNGNITGGNGSVITGDAYAVGTITGVTVNGQKKTGQPAEPLPTFDAAFWKQKAQEGGTITGDYTPENNSTIGPIYITGDLIIGNNVSLTVQGPVYASGKITFGNEPTLTVDNSLGNHGVMLIAEGPISFGNKIYINKNQGGGYLLIGSTSTSTAMSIGNNAGSVNAPLYAPNGKIDIGNSAQAVAFTGNQVVTGNGAIVDYDEGLASATFSTGPGGTWVIQKGTLQEY